VVWNLLSNAVKFTGDGGRVSVLLRRRPQSVEIKVSDTGKGISAEFLPVVFERFRQADASTTREQGGLGLGLAIVQQLVELHGGHIRAESPGEGQGATFTLQLPLQDVWLGPRASSRGGAAALRPFAPSPVLKGARVLVVEDDAQTRTVVRWLLEQCEAEVTAVDSAAEALDAYRAAAARGRPYDALVSDIGMVDQDGFELIRNVRALEREVAASAPVPAVALTAYAGEEDRLRAFAAGYQTFLAKPVGPAELVEVVAESIGRHAG
jgi:CheY-like chemotaxis protein